MKRLFKRNFDTSHCISSCGGRLCGLCLFELQAPTGKNGASGGEHD